MDIGECGLIALARTLEFQDFEKLRVSWLSGSRAKENNDGGNKQPWQLFSLEERKKNGEQNLSGHLYLSTCHQL